jgi:sporulation protein YlmC with PRC-barrel domain
MEKEDDTTKKIIYSLMAVFAFSILFVGAGISSSQEFPEGMITMYGQSDINGWDTLEASSMIGAQLLTTEGDYLGQISDLVIDSETGHVLEVILSDVPGRGARSVTVPFAALLHTGNGIFVFNRPEEYVGHFMSKGGPSFEEPFTHWVETRALYYVEPIPMSAFHVTALLGSPVQTSGGEEVARVNDFVIDFSSDQVVYSVLSDVGGSEGKMVAVPFGELSKSDRNTFTLNTTKEKLVDSPSFRMADMSDHRYAENVYSYYGVQPYWEEK